MGMNFNVFQASAGSGKTYTIVKEYLKLCLCGFNQVENYRHILAITFTNASANDMKAKIVDELVKIIESDTIEPKTMGFDLVNELNVNETELKEKAKSLLTLIMHDYSSFCVSTIDAFVQKLSRAFAHDLGLPQQYAVSIDSDDVAETIVGNIGAQISDENPFLVQLLQDFSNDRFANQKSTNLEGLLADFVKKLMNEKAYQKDENSNIKNVFQYNQTLEFLQMKMKGFEQRVKRFVDDFRQLETEHGLSVGDYSYGRAGFWSFVNKLAQGQYEQPGKRFVDVAATGKWYSADAKKHYPDADLNRIGEQIKSLFSAFQNYYNQEFGKYLFYKTQRDLLYLYALRSVIRGEFERMVQEDEVVHISEFNKLLQNVMGDFSVPFVYERIGERYQHVFVDEFQDTSVMQWHNLLPLVDNGLSAGNMSMVVGDGKQSIYRFRNGEVGQITQLPEIYAFPMDERAAAFRQYQQNLEQAFVFRSLDTNYRSFRNIVAFNNAFFEQACQMLSPDLQKVYKDENQQFNKTVSIAQRPDKKKEGLVQVELFDAENQPNYCFERIVQLIHELTGKGYRYEDISILTRKTDFGSDIANYLNNNGIPVISQVSILLKSSNKVQLIINTLRHLIYPDNEIYVANLLYYRRLTLVGAFDGTIDGLFDNVKPIAQGTMAIEPVLGIDRDTTLADTFAKATCLYDLCASLIRLYKMDSIRDAFLNYFLEEVNQWQSSLHDSVVDFLSFWEQKQYILAVKSVSGNALNITTIHKSKGLQYPVVIYPEAIIDLDEKLNVSKAAEEWLQPQDLGFEAIPNLDKVLFKLDKNAENMGEKAAKLVEAERESNRLDNLNLLYVVFTRAVQRLYIIAKQGKVDKPNIIRDFLSEKEDHRLTSADVPVALYRFGEPDFSNPKANDKEDAAVSVADSVSSDWFHKISVDPTPTLLWRSEDNRLQPREWGELVHEILAKIRTADEIEKVLSTYLADGTIDAKNADWIRDRFLQMTQNEQIAIAFNPSAKVKTECEILYHGEVRRFDRYAELPDVIYLLDYKTGKKDPKHNKQLDDYVAAIGSLTDKDIRGCLVYLLEDSIEVVKE